jgi:hypothetical protein
VIAEEAAEGGLVKEVEEMGLVEGSLELAWGEVVAEVHEGSGGGGGGDASLGALLDRLAGSVDPDAHPPTK